MKPKRCVKCGKFMSYGKLHQARMGKGMGWRCKGCGHEVVKN